MGYKLGAMEVKVASLLQYHSDVSPCTENAKLSITHIITLRATSQAAKNIDFRVLKPISKDFLGHFTYGTDMSHRMSTMINFPNFHSHRARNDTSKFLKLL